MIRTVFEFLLRDLQIQVSYKLSFLLQIVSIFPVVLMFYFLALFFGESVSGPLKQYGGHYFPFVLIGIAVQNYFTFALSSFAGSIREAQLSGTLEAIFSTPVRTTTFLIGSALYAFVFNSIRILVYLIFGALVSGIVFNLSSLPGALLVIVLSIGAFSSMGVLSASFILLFKKGDPLSWLFNVVSWLLGGVFYPISVLPNWFQRISDFIPMTHSLEALRMLLLNQGNLASVSDSLINLIIWTLVGLPVSYLCFLYALNRGRVKGNLGHY